jgi:malonyl-CoA/methylmalonyl-CoA synthetase
VGKRRAGLRARVVTGLYAAVERRAREHANRIAFEVHGGPQITFAELLAGVECCADYLVRIGVGAGDRVVAQVEKSLGTVLLYLATLRQGAVYVPLNTGYTDAELGYFIDDARPRVIVVENERRSSVETLAPDLAVTTLATIATHRRAAVPSVQVDGGALAAIVYTSGTTGRSKGAMLSHDNLFTNAATLVEQWRFDAADVLVHALPLYHVHGLFVGLHCALLAGAQTRLLPRFDAAMVQDALVGASVFMGVPTYYTRLLADPAFPNANVRLRLWISGSAPLLPETFAEFERRTGTRILERYGMSEAGMITSNPLAGPRRAGTVGPPLPGIEARVRDSHGAIAVAGTPGVLEIRGPNVFGGYWRNPEKTRESFTDDGWFVTGDVAVMDPDGVVSIVGREKDLIISGGLNVYPREIESEIDALLGVRESAVVGVPHADFGEAVIAVIDRAGTEPDAATVTAALRGRLAAFKVPKRVFFVEGLPRNAMGKVQKNVLRERFRDAFRP